MENRIDQKRDIQSFNLKVNIIPSDRNIRSANHPVLHIFGGNLSNRDSKMHIDESSNSSTQVVPSLSSRLNQEDKRSMRIAQVYEGDIKKL